MIRLLLTFSMAVLVSACASMTPRNMQPEPEVLYFDTDSAALRPASIAYLNQLSDFLNANENYDVVIEGFTDSTASDEYNLKLSERRAHAVQSHLAARGVAPERTTTAAYGEQRPADDNQNKAGRQQNRRVVVSAVQREVMVMSAPNGGVPKYNYTSTDPKIAGTAYNSGVRPTHR